MILSLLQWSGTASLIAMYLVMSFWPELYPLNILLGLIGGSFYFAWSTLVKNRAQILVNAAGIVVCVLGLVRWSFG